MCFSYLLSLNLYAHLGGNENPVPVIKYIYSFGILIGMMAKKNKN